DGRVDVGVEEDEREILSAERARSRVEDLGGVYASERFRERFVVPEREVVHWEIARDGGALEQSAPDVARDRLRLVELADAMTRRHEEIRRDDVRVALETRRIDEVGDDDDEVL